jgi:uncharacterized iron-regulated membrane protein
MRRWLLFVHRWLGLGTSLILAVVGTTGTIMVWPGNSVAHRMAESLHVSLAMGRPGRFIVIIVTGLAVVLQITGVWLWWKRRVFRVRLDAGWRQTVTDLHHTVGALGFVLMLLLAASAVGRVVVKDPDVRPVISRLHTAQGFPLPVRILYAAASMGFLLQGVTGLTMWWPAKRR